MQEKLLYEYAVIRVVPRVEREEFLNVGVVLFCKKTGFLEAKFVVDEKRIRNFCELIDIEVLHQHLETFSKICRGDSHSGPIAKLPVAERFRWLTATRSTIVQTSKTHPGFSDDPGATLQKLFDQLVAQVKQA
jgi:hypothetical protein